MKRPHWPRWSTVPPANPAQQRRDGGNADGLGATLLSARIPLSDGSVREALLGCASRNTTLNRRRSSAPLLAVTRTVSPIAVIRLPAKPYS